MGEHGLLRLIKLTVIQMVHSTSSLLTTIPTLSQILKDHSEFNPTKMERLKKMLDEKEVALVERAKEVSRWVRKEAKTQEKLKVTNELLLKKEQELEAEWQRLETEKVELEAKL